MLRSRRAAVLVALSSTLAGFVSARCERPAVVSVFPPLDICCQCLATSSTPRGARCSRGTVTDCVQDMEKLDILGSETNIRCLRTVCEQECGFLGQFLPPESATRACCDCLANTDTAEGAACFPGTSEECVTELEEGEPNKILQGAGCFDSVCQAECQELLGAPADAGQAPDAGGGGGDGGPDGGGGGPPDAGNVDPLKDGGPFLPFDGGRCPTMFPCF